MSSSVEFTVPAGLIGLEGLATAPTQIVSVDVMGGTKDAVVLSILCEYEEQYLCFQGLTTSLAQSVSSIPVIWTSKSRM